MTSLKWAQLNLRTRVQFREWESNWHPVSRHVLASEAAGFAIIQGSNGRVSHPFASVRGSHKGLNWRGLARDCTPPPNRKKPTLRGWLFFAYYRVFARVPAGSCGLRSEPFLPVTGTVYSPFAYSLSDPPHPLQVEVRKARPSPSYKSMTYARTNRAVFLWHWIAKEN